MLIWGLLNMADLELPKFQAEDVIAMHRVGKYSLARLQRIKMSLSDSDSTWQTGFPVLFGSEVGTLVFFPFFHNCGSTTNLIFFPE